MKLVPPVKWLLKCAIQKDIQDRGGLLVEHRAPNQMVLGPIRTWGAVLCPWARQSYSPHYCLIPRHRWLRPDITEKFVTATLSINTNKQKDYLYLEGPLMY